LANKVDFRLKNIRPSANEVDEIYYRADKYHYSVNLVRVKRQGKWTWTTEVETSA